MKCCFVLRRVELRVVWLQEKKEKEEEEVDEAKSQGDELEGKRMYRMQW